MRWIVAMAVLLVAGLTALLGSRALAAEDSGRIVSSGYGRYQIVNGTPGFARNIMLLDSVTGATWISCNGEDGAVGWCSMFRSNKPGTVAAASER